MRASRFAAFALALSATPALGAPMNAGVEPVTVLAFQVDAMADAELDLAAKSLTNALRQVVLDAPEYTLGGQSPTLYAVAYDIKCSLRVARGRSVDERTFDEACLRKVGKHLEKRRFFWGFLAVEGGRPVARLHLWQQGERDRVASLPYDPSARDRIAERLYRKLVTPEKVGDLALVGAAEGELVVDGKAAGPYASGVELTLPVGERSIEVRREGKTVARTRVTIVAGQASEARLELALAPPTNVGSPMLPNHLPPVETTGEAWKRPAGFVGLGLGAALLGAGVFASLRVGALNDRLRSEGPYAGYRSAFAGEAMCDAASAGREAGIAGAASARQVSDTCSQASTFRTLQFLSYGLAALSAGAGAYLLWSAPKGPSGPPARGAPSGLSLRGVGLTAPGGSSWGVGAWGAF
jgi:hypothetical protein